MDALRIDRLPDGGFVVTSIPELGAMSVCRFASSSIDEAIGYIKGELDPEAVKGYCTKACHGVDANDGEACSKPYAGEPMTAEQFLVPAAAPRCRCGALPDQDCLYVNGCSAKSRPIR